MVVMDEINDALMFGLLTPEAVREVAAKRPEHTELILTGRGAPDVLIEMADLVTEMRAIKHYFDKGVMARQGIEY
jgi:cob(I)alamin adenosyltransferase